MTRRKLIALVAATIAVLAAAPGAAAPCAVEQPARRVTGVEECIALRTFRGAAASASPTLVVVVHGDIVGGGTADYHFAAAERIASAHDDVVVAALLRPGYADAAGNASSGDMLGRVDNYTAAYVDEIAGAIGRLKTHHRARRTVFVGHSGGAAFGAIILGRHPGLLDGALIVACPCDLDEWLKARRRGPWTRSVSPIAVVDQVAPTARVVALGAGADWVTPPFLTETYARRLKERGVDVRAAIVPRVTHTGLFRDPAVAQAVAELIAEPMPAASVDIVAMFAKAAGDGRTGLARKTKPVDARPARRGEVVVTIIRGEGKETQSRPAAASDFVVRNRCPATGNEQYLVRGERFAERYGPPISRAARGGWRGYEPRGEEMRFFILGAGEGPFAFKAPWGEAMVARPGDAIVQSPRDPKDTYRVAAASFACTYEIVKSP